MTDRLEIELKNEIDDIVGRIDTIMKKFDELSPKEKEEQQVEEPVEISGEEKEISEGS